MKKRTLQETIDGYRELGLHAKADEIERLTADLCGRLLWLAHITLIEICTTEGCEGPVQYHCTESRPYCADCYMDLIMRGKAWGSMVEHRPIGV